MFSNWNILLWEYDFLSPHWLWLLLAVPFVSWYLFRNESKRSGDWKFTGSQDSQSSYTLPWVPLLRKSILLMQIAVLILFILALAKPFNWNSDEAYSENYKNGIDIILAMDVSSSMLAMDFEPNRLEASKKVAKEFVDGRNGDKIGLVVYAGEAYTACPATLDYDILKDQIDKISGEYLVGGTAIGTGLGTAVARLRNDSIQSKVVILLTDGQNTSGDIDPLTAAELARAKNIRVYTIGVGSHGMAPTPVMTPFGMRYQNMPVEIDEETLMKIASIGNGKYFRATDEASLKSIYQEIEQLEKRRVLDRRFKQEPPSTPLAFLNWSIVFILLSWTLKRVLFKYE